jgi:quercetin dioxygenase-like cupin family protein
MQIMRRGQAPAEVGTTFTGHVTLERVHRMVGEGAMGVSIVHFDDGALTNWHVHPGEQVLVILDGKGRAGTEDESFEVEPGDIIYAGPGERHWHGAAPGHSMTHVSITTVGAPTWFEAPE